MKITLPPPLSEAPPPCSFWQDFKLLFVTQLRLTWNKIRHWSPLAWFSIIAAGCGAIILIYLLGNLAYGALETMSPEVGRGFLALIFMTGFIALIFFGITSAFATLYMSEDLELLFIAPVSTKVVFSVKLLVVAGSNFVTAAFFIFLPGLFYGLLLGTKLVYYLWLILITIGLCANGTAFAALLNLIVMRIIPPHRSREAVGVLGAVAGIIIALVFQIPNLILSTGDEFDLGIWLATQEKLLQVMDFFPWGWGSLALAEGASGNHLTSLGWSTLLLLLGAALMVFSFLFVERGFRRGFISLGQSEGGRRRKKKHFAAGKVTEKSSAELFKWSLAEDNAAVVSPWRGMWAVAKKDLLYVRRDTREWFGYTVPLIIMAFFVFQFVFTGSDSSQGSLTSVLIMYSIMFSGNMALQSFGREGESEWFLNSVPLAGWPVVWGKLFASVLPTLVLMEALLAGTAIAIGLSPTITLALAVGAVLITMGSSAIGLFFSINNCRYNPDAPQQRISPGASLLMYLINLFFIALIAVGVLYLFPPAELLTVLQELPAPPPFSWTFSNIFIYIFYLLSRPLTWSPNARVLTGLVVTAVIWTTVFFSFLALTVRQSLKGFRVEIVTTSKKKSRKRKLGRVS
ncbi:MAG: putative ABC transporter permease subunit [Dethiobacteria bacterium]